jgi:GTP-binding protein Era
MPQNRSKPSQPAKKQASTPAKPASSKSAASKSAAKPETKVGKKSSASQALVTAESAKSPKMSKALQSPGAPKAAKTAKAANAAKTSKGAKTVPPSSPKPKPRSAPSKDALNPSLDSMLSKLTMARTGGHDDAAMPASQQRCGLVAIVGRPNVGKSTLLNAMVGQKVSITSRKAQTTRHRITGIRTEGDTQFVFVDTPGFQTQHTVRGTAALNRNLNKTVQATLSDVDVVLFLVEAGRYGAGDAKVVGLLPEGKPVILVANKLDLVHRREDLFPWLEEMKGHHAFAEFVPLCAQKEDDTKRLMDILRPYLPQQAWWYDSEALTDRTDRFLASEIVREKLFRLTGDELPYTSTVVIDQYTDEPPPPGNSKSTGMVRIAATIIVERDTHKGMVIGDKGEKLKRIGTEARTELEKLLGRKVFLEVWVKVRSGWADDETRLRTYGYE